MTSPAAQPVQSRTPHDKRFRIVAWGVACALALLLVSSQTSATVTAQGTDKPRPESTRPSPIKLDPEAGSNADIVYEAFLSPQQEGGEESDTPAFTPKEFLSTAPSVPRNERTSRGHSVIEFANDLSKAYVHLAVKNVKPEDITMLHLHCGLPGQLGPILVDFALAGDLPTFLADGLLTLEVTNEDIVNTASHSHGLVGAFTIGCPIILAVPNDRVKTIAGMETIARQGQLYFNLHTKGQTFFGDIRGQFYLVNDLKGASK